MRRRRKLLDLGIWAAVKFDQIAYYGNLWLIEFRDNSRLIVIEDAADSPEENYRIFPVACPCCGLVNCIEHP